MLPSFLSWMNEWTACILSSSDTIRKPAKAKNLTLEVCCYQHWIDANWSRMPLLGCWLGRAEGHITPILAMLHWMPIKFRIYFKITLTTYKSLHCQAPAYIGELLSPYSMSKSLRSLDQGLLAIPQSRRKMKGDRSFATVTTRIWNSLPIEIRSANTLETFKQCLKINLIIIIQTGLQVTCY